MSLECAALIYLRHTRLKMSKMSQCWLFLIQRMQNARHMAPVSRPTINRSLQKSTPTFQIGHLQPVRRDFMTAAEVSSLKTKAMARQLYVLIKRCKNRIPTKDKHPIRKNSSITWVILFLLGLADHHQDRIASQKLKHMRTQNLLGCN